MGLMELAFRTVESKKPLIPDVMDFQCQ